MTLCHMFSQWEWEREREIIGSTLEMGDQVAMGITREKGQDSVTSCSRTWGRKKVFTHSSLWEWNKADTTDRKGIFGKSDELCFEVWTWKMGSKKGNFFLCSFGSNSEQNATTNRQKCCIVIYQKVVKICNIVSPSLVRNSANICWKYLFHPYVPVSQFPSP